MITPVLRTPRPPRTSRARIAVTAHVLVAAALLTGCGDSGDDGKSAGLRIGIAPNAVLDAATAGLRTDEKLKAEAGKVSFSSLRSPDEMRTQLTSGSVDVLTLPSNIAANLHSRGVDVRILGIIDGPVDVLVGPPSASTSWESLRGETVHIAFKGDVNDVLFRSLAEKNGLKPGEDFEIVNHPSLPDLLTAVGAGKAEYALLPEHQASLASARAQSAGKPKKPILALGAEWKKKTGQETLPTYAVGVRGKYADANPEVVRHLHQALARSTQSAGAHGDDLAAGVAERTGAPQPLVTGLLARLEPAYSTARDVQAGLTALFTELAAASPALVGGKVPGDGLYVTEGS
ncbi:ABC transporter substrate-binding protein [Streptomyces sp. NPDC058953]|uniref:ABC transporter substrate-binding protein n=1 Tax=unclassified Streptomyces TaxID=2593676 RepID=UPI0036A6AD70